MEGRNDTLEEFELNQQRHHVTFVQWLTTQLVTGHRSERANIITGSERLLLYVHKAKVQCPIFYPELQDKGEVLRCECLSSVYGIAECL